MMFYFQEEEIHKNNNIVSIYFKFPYLHVPKWLERGGYDTGNQEEEKGDF